uniref:RBR-type E3 ubiquitin transferase n=1 Tax=Panagrolaimus sp. PS1159 TaxID=55785 RepID=A0AC35F9Q8_9BILA
MGDEFVQTFTQTCDINVKGFFNFPSFIASEEFSNIKFMFDFHWLNTVGTNKQCLFTIPQTNKNNISNFSSVVKLECIQRNAKKRYIKITINAIHDFDFKSLLSKKHNSKPAEDIKAVIIELYNIFLKNSIPFNIKPPMTTFNPALTISSYPLGDFELLYRCQSSPSDVLKMDDYEIIYSNIKCNLCYKSNDLTTLQCSHVFCNDCSTKSIKKQIRNLDSILGCEICETPFDPLFVISSTPLLLLQYYLRFIKSKDNSVICPSCNGVLIISKDKIKYGNVHCEECNITFCAECHDLPHFPLDCKEMKIWTSKVLHEGKILSSL